jgi:hypothetical protein
MNIKTKLMTVVIATILVLPSIFNTKRDSGEVLGISEVQGVETTPVETIKLKEDIPKEITPAKPADIIKVDTPKSLLKIPNPFKNTFSKDNSENNNTIKTSSNARIKDISSGIRDVNGISTIKEVELPKSKNGKIKWEKAENQTIISSVYPVGSGVRVKIGDSYTDLVVTGSRVLVPGTLLVVDQNTYLQLGGNPESQTTIDAEVIVN